MLSMERCSILCNLTKWPLSSSSCCGKYNATIFVKIAGRTVHWCPANIQTGACKEAEVNKEGCGYEFSEKFKNTFFDFNALFILAFIFYAFQVAVMAMAWQLSRKLKIPDDVFQMKFQMTNFEWWTSVLEVAGDLQLRIDKFQETT